MPFRQSTRSIAIASEGVFRHELAALHDDAARHFEVYLRREYAHRGTGNREADSARGAALSSAEPFCKAHGLSMSSTYSFGVCGGEQGAHRLAHEWCRRMQHFHDGFEQADGQCDWLRVIASFPLDEDFESWVSSSDNAAIRQRAAQIAGIVPH